MKRRSARPALAAFFLVSTAPGWWMAGKLGHTAEKSESTGVRRTVPPSGPAAGAHTALDDWIAAVHRASSPTARCRAAVDLAAAIPPADFRRALERRGDLPAHETRDFFAFAVLHRWLTTDPKAALTWCLEHHDTMARDAMGAWAQLDPRAAEAYLADHPRSSKAVTGFFDGLAQKDPAAAIAVAAAHGAWQADDLSRGFETLAQADPQRLLDAAPTFSVQAEAVARKAATAVMARRDFSKTLEWARTQPDASDLIHAVARAAPDGLAFLSVVSQAPERERVGLISNDFLGLSKWDAAELLHALAAGVPGIDARKGRTMTDASWAGLVNRDPQEAIRLAGELKMPAEWKSAEAIARQWATKDPTAALAWAESLGPTGIDAAALGDLKAKVATTTEDLSPVERSVAEIRSGRFDPAVWSKFSTAEERDALLAALVKPGAGPQNAVESTFHAFAMFFPGEYAAWALREPESDQRNGHLDSALWHWSMADPQAASTWITNELPDAQRPKAIGTLLTYWKMHDPDGAKAWFRALPEETRRSVTPPAKDW